MTPFQQFRKWARRAPVSERIGALVAVILAVAVLAYVVVPDTKATSVDSGATAAASATATSLATAAGGATPTTLPSSGPAGAGGATAVVGPGAVSAGGAPRVTPTAASGRCANLTSTDVGVTATEIHVGIEIDQIEGPAGNSLFGLATPDEQQQYFQAAIDAVNASGGVACRKMVPKYYVINGADPAAQHAGCLQLQQDKMFAAIDNGVFYSPTNAKDCVAQLGIPFFVETPMAQAEQQRFYPYLFSYSGIYEQLHRDTMLASRDLGFFDKASGFKKLGILLRNCGPTLGPALIAGAEAAGVQASEIVTYDVGCPDNFASPDQLQQAVLKFKTAGVTHMTSSNMTADLPTFTRIAQAQGFHPRYSIPDDGIIATTQTPEFHPDATNFDGALSITYSRYGEENSNAPRGPGTVECDKEMAKAGLPPTYKEPVGTGGNACDLVWMFRSAADHAPTLTRRAMADGLGRAPAIDFSFPQGQGVFGRPGVTTASIAWRPAVYHADCQCWKIPDLQFKPSFK